MGSKLDFSPILLTLHLAFVSTILLLLIGLPLAWWLSRSKAWFKTLIEAIVSLPIILPPTVLGFYLLLLLSPKGFLGSTWFSMTGGSLAFTFTGLVIGSILYSLPFVVQPLQTAFEGIGKWPLETAATLRASFINGFFTVILPMAKQGLLSATILGFAHTLGEFGVVLMIGGNIPGKTQVISIAIYESVEKLDFLNAHLLSGGMIGCSFAFLFFIFLLNRRVKMAKPT